jgi:hypothetical protein
MERALVDPLSTWIPPVIQTVLMLLALAAYWRRKVQSEAATAQADNERYKAILQSMTELTKGFTDMRLALANFVTIDRHSESMAKIHEKVNEQSRKIAIILDRQQRPSQLSQQIGDIALETYHTPKDPNR